MLLDGFASRCTTPPASRCARLRSLASVVKNEVITIAGNSLVLPVAPGYRVRGATQSRPPRDDRSGVAVRPLQAAHAGRAVPRECPDPRVSSRRPSRASATRARRSRPTGSRTGAGTPSTSRPRSHPITPADPASQDWQAAWREFAQPMVNIQNAPGAPAPGAGLAGLATAHHQRRVQRHHRADANQQNAIRTYLSNQEAKAFAEMAKEMAMQATTPNTARSWTLTAARTRALTQELREARQGPSATADRRRPKQDGRLGSLLRAPVRASRRPQLRRPVGGNP